MAKTKDELQAEVESLTQQRDALAADNERLRALVPKSQQVTKAHEPDITIPDLARMDGAGGTNSEYVLYPIPVSKLVELEKAIEIANHGPSHRGTQRIREDVSLSDFNMAAFEEHLAGLAHLGQPQYLAFRHKKTGKSQAGFAFDDPGGNPKHLPTAVVLGQLAVPD